MILESPIWNWIKLDCKGEIPKGRNSHTAVVSKNHLYIFGGASLDGCLNDLYRLNLDTCMWEKIKAKGDLPSAREMHSCALLDENSMLIFMGRSPQGLLDDAILLDLSKLL